MRQWDWDWKISAETNQSIITTVTNRVTYLCILVASNKSNARYITINRMKYWWAAWEGIWMSHRNAAKWWYMYFSWIHCGAAFVAVRVKRLVRKFEKYGCWPKTKQKRITAPHAITKKANKSSCDRDGIGSFRWRCMEPCKFVTNTNIAVASRQCGNICSGMTLLPFRIVFV